MQDLSARGVGLRVLTGQGAQIDTTTAAGRLVFGIFAALAEFERELIRERTLAGRAAATAAGSLRCRKPWNRTPRLRGSCAPAFLVLTKSGRSACALDLLNVSGGYAARAGRGSGEARSWPAASPQG